jgi:hypothetical protein
VTGPEGIHDAAARNMLLDATAVGVLRRLAAAGVEAILLKGPSTERLLYPEGFRDYGDVDVLVPAGEMAAAATVLTAMGFADPHNSWTAELHAETWRDERDVKIDLHRRIEGVTVPPDAAWAILERNTEQLDVAGGRVRTLNDAGRTLHLTLHAAQHARREAKPLRDLARGVEVIAETTWAAAAALAAHLGASGTMRAGLGLVDGGQDLADRLGLDHEMPLETALRLRDLPLGALAVDRFVQARGHGPKLAVLRSELFPKPDAIRAHSRYARSRLGLALAYAVRPFWLAAQSRRVISAWRQAQRSRPQR